MIPYRAYAIADLVVHAVGLWLLVGADRWLDIDSDVTTVSLETAELRWVLLGGAWAVGYRVLCDRDIWSLRRSKLRRVVGRGLPTVVSLALGSNAKSDRTAPAVSSFGVGSILGAVVYRIRYGLLEAP
ncbi:hypothetical protein D8Y22_20345 [Salinadaptatus halalkaliphilus]|uniref:DUF8097 domain-containing protein n=1 Tax=Salinadaptatus halalkaliphilus TaxID=2419781 RepID=A0A4S3TFX3_9EURY|nr:hypothetical protein [Salinadaptatus halalkaliphilus]THE62814.1 hypothetical protein D8Y22_20345 [Salinadaptatus halalkaliphilus]